MKYRRPDTTIRATQRPRAPAPRDGDGRAKWDRYGTDRVVNGVALDTDDLVVPSDEEEFDDWAARKAAAGAEAARTPTPRPSSSPVLGPTQQVPSSPAFIHTLATPRTPSSSKRRRINSTSPDGTPRYTTPSNVPSRALETTPVRLSTPVRDYTPDPLLLVTPARTTPASSRPRSSAPPGFPGGSDSPLTQASPLPSPSPPPSPPVDAVPPLADPIDPDLARFRSTRTFRTRTTLQLQPYTRERLLYEAALRRGGLKAVPVEPATQQSESIFQPRPPKTPKPPRTKPASPALSPGWSESDQDLPAVPPPLTPIAGSSQSEVTPRHSPYRSLPLPAHHDVSDNSDDSNASAAQSAYPSSTEADRRHRDKRERIAGRMLPRAALKRLEEAEAAKRFERKGKANKSSRSGPGVAVRRPAPAPHLERSEPESEPDSGGSQAIEVGGRSRRSHTKQHRSSSRRIISDRSRRPPEAPAWHADLGERLSDSDPVIEMQDDSSGSEAVQVDHAHETLVRIRNADFDSIIAGRSPKRRRRQMKRPRQRQTRLDEGTLFAKFTKSTPSARQQPQEQPFTHRLSVDFNVEPLPGKLSAGFVMRYCHDLIGFLDTLQADAPEACWASGISFEPDMSVDELIAALPAYQVDEAGLAFLSAYISHLLPGDIARLQPPLHTLITAGTDSLAAKWWQIDLATRMQRLLPNEDNETVLRDLSINTLEYLLSLFDKAIRPLRSVLTGESLTSRITDEITIAWIALVNLFDLDSDWTSKLLIPALQNAFDTGPLGAERVWYLVFGIAAISQFDSLGSTGSIYVAKPRWDIVRHAISLVTISEDGPGHVESLRGRDQYVRTIMARCLLLASKWQWQFDANTFSIVSRDLGAIFKSRHFRNLPTEPDADFPEWITRFDISAAAHSASRDIAFEIYLRLLVMAANDMISVAKTLSAARAAERDIQRLIMSVIPVSPATFGPAQLINRYSLAIAACYFSPALLDWLMAATEHWAPFSTADLHVRQVTIRGLMYLAVVCRHHAISPAVIVARLANNLAILSREAAASPSLEANRVMVLVIACVRQIILHDGFAPEMPTYPDPVLLDKSWIDQIFSLSVEDYTSGLEITSTLQAYCDARLAALPETSRRRREKRLETQDWESFELNAFTLQELGEISEISVAETQDPIFAKILAETIAPGLYRLLSNLLPVEAEQTPLKQKLLKRLSALWSDCAVILVIDHPIKTWSDFTDPYGSLSYARLADARGRAQVGSRLFSTILRVDPKAIDTEDAVAFLFSVIGHNSGFVAAFLPMSTSEILHGCHYDGPESLPGIMEVICHNLRTTFVRRKSFAYRCINLLMASFQLCEKSFISSTLATLQRVLGEHVNAQTVPSLRNY